MTAQKFTNFVFFLKHTNMKAVTMRSNKIVSNEVIDKEVLLEPSYGKNLMNILANLIVV